MVSREAWEGTLNMVMRIIPAIVAVGWDWDFRGLNNGLGTKVILRKINCIYK